MILDFWLSSRQRCSWRHRSYLPTNFGQSTRPCIPAASSTKVTSIFHVVPLLALKTDSRAVQPTGRGISPPLIRPRCSWTDGIRLAASFPPTIHGRPNRPDENIHQVVEFMLDYQLLVDQMSKEQIAVAKAVLKSALAKAKNPAP